MKKRITLDLFLKQEQNIEEETETASSHFPSNWKRVRLKEIAQIIGGGTPRRNNPEYWGGDIPWLTPSELEDDKLNYIFDTKEKITRLGLENSNAQLIPPDSVILTCTASVGKVGINKIQLTTNQQFNSFVCNRSLIIPEFLAYYLMLNKDKIQKLGGETTFRFIRKDIIGNLIVPLPSLDVQRRVVARLEEISARIEQAKKLREEALKETEKIMQTTLYQIFSKPEQKGWKLSTLEEVAPIQSNSIQSLDPDKLYNYISLEHIESNTGRLINFAPTPGAEIKSSKIAFTREHILYGKLRPYLNKVFVPDFDGICTTELVPLLPRKEILTREFLAWQMRSPQFVNYAMFNLTGTRMPRISIEALKNAKVAIPPIDEQIRIATLLDKLQNQIAEIRQRQKETVEKLEKMTQTILKKAFMGEL
jgi:restriction endonuclease S subunit